MYYFQYWFFENEQGIIPLNHVFENMSLKYSSLYTRMQIILKFYIVKLFKKIYFEGKGIFEIIVTNQNWHENVQ